MTWMIGEIIVEKRATRVMVVVRRSNKRLEELDTEDNEVVHYTTEDVHELYYAFLSGKGYTYCIKSALTIGVARDLRLVIQTL